MAKIKFENGTVVDFDGNPTPADVEEVAKSLNLKPGVSPTAPKDKSITSSPVGSAPVIKQATQIGTGIGTEIGKAGLNIGKGVLKASGFVSKLLSKISGQPATDYQPYMDKIDEIKTDLYQKPFEKELSTVGGKVGKIAGAVAPYVATGGTTSALGNAGAKALNSTGAVGRVAGGVGGEVIGNYLTGYLLTGGNKKEALTQALTAGLFKAVTAGAGEALKKTKIGENMVTKIFKTDKQEVLAGFRGTNTTTLAKEAIDRGISGNVDDMAGQLIKGQTESEAALAKEFARLGNPKIVLEDPKTVISYIQNKANLLRKAGAIREAQGLESSLPSINAETGEITAGNALALRRFLDGLRTEKSFVAQTEELAAQQAGLKEMADEIRHKVNSLGATGAIMKDYQFYIKALDKLTRYATTTKNADALGLINTFLLGESVASTNPALAGVAIGRKLLSTAKGRTQFAQFIKNLPKSSPAGASARAIMGALLGKANGK